MRSALSITLGADPDRNVNIPLVRVSTSTVRLPWRDVDVILDSLDVVPGPVVAVDKSVETILSPDGVCCLPVADGVVTSSTPDRIGPAVTSEPAVTAPLTLNEIASCPSLEIVAVLASPKGVLAVPAPREIVMTAEAYGVITSQGVDTLSPGSVAGVVVSVGEVDDGRPSWAT